MAKPRKFYESLNQPDWISNGAHRRPDKKAHGNPAEQSGSSTRGTTTVRTIIPAGSWRALSAGVSTRKGANYTVFPAFAEDPTPIPYAGVRTGELIGHRAWMVIQDEDGLHLSSLAHYRLWAVGETIYGDINKALEDDHWIWRHFQLMAGVYSHFSPELVMEQTKDFVEVEYPKQIHKSKHTVYELMVFGNTLIEYATLVGIAYGTIECWGEVVEHELGYRAEYAKLKSLDSFHGCFDFEKLREKYLGQS